MPQVRLRDGEQVECHSVDLSRPGWVQANTPGENVQFIPESNVSRVLSVDGSDVSFNDPTGDLAERDA